MTHRFCHRCQADLPAHDEGTLIFCVHCGAPQILLSEELQTQLEAQTSAAAEGASAAAETADARALIKAGALRCVALAGAIAAGLLFLSMLFGPIILLAFLWAVVSPVVVLGLFQARFPLAPIKPGFGARIGFLTGLAVALVFNVVYAVTMLIARFGTHGMGAADKQMTLVLDQFRVQAEAQQDTPPMLFAFLHNLSVPEFRAGFMLLGVAMMTVFLLVVTTAGGAFAGFVRSRVRA